jgi:hypothetical protein
MVIRPGKVHIRLFLPSVYLSSVNFKNINVRKIYGSSGWFDKRLVNTIDGKLQQGWTVWILLCLGLLNVLI